MRFGLAKRPKLSAGAVDSVDIVAGRLLRVTGWSQSEPELRVTVNGRETAPNAIYATYRPDVATHLGVDEKYLGFLYEYLLAPDVTVEIAVYVNGTIFKRLKHSTGSEVPYGPLLAMTRVLHRDGIYCEGPPSTSVDPCIMALALKLPDPILDFGTGGCAVLLALRALGREVYGVEIAGSLAASKIPREAREFVAIYDGARLPFQDGAFASVIASEVVEHIPDFETALAEISRVVLRGALFTVPDNTVLPVCAQAGLIPWHYLTADHVNFFTRESLDPLLKRHFTMVSFSRAAQAIIGGVPVWTNLEALCWK